MKLYQLLFVTRFRNTHTIDGAEKLVFESEEDAKARAERFIGDGNQVEIHEVMLVKKQ